MFKLALLAIADCVNPETLVAWPSVRHLTEKTGLSSKSIRRAVEWAEQNGELATKPHEIGKRLVSLEYRFPLFEPPKRVVSPTVVPQTTPTVTTQAGQPDHPTVVPQTTPSEEPVSVNHPENLESGARDPISDGDMDVIALSMASLDVPYDLVVAAVEVWNRCKHPAQASEPTRPIMAWRRQKLGEFLQALGRDLDAFERAVRAFAKSPAHNGTSGSQPWGLDQLLRHPDTWVGAALNKPAPAASAALAMLPPDPETAEDLEAIWAQERAYAERHGLPQ